MAIASGDHAVASFNGVEAFLYCQLEGAVGDETVTLARQQSTDIFILVRWTLFRIKLCE